MANQEHVDRLRQGVADWNQWRKQHPDIRPDLSCANLAKADLTHANLGEADLTQAILRRAILSSTDFSKANLNGIDLRGVQLNKAHLREANLHQAKLGGANLSSACLARANLSDANLQSAELFNTDLGYANLSRASLGNTDLFYTKLLHAELTEVDFENTVFRWVDLSNVKGLETAIHRGPSTVDIDSVKLPHDEHIRKHFLRGIGFTETQIEYLPSLLAPRSVRYQSLFISYAHQDEVLARQLYIDLYNKDVPCWFAPEDMKIGEKIRPRIDEAIHLHEKLLLVLSEHSVASQWVEKEVETAFEKEQRQKCLVLFPIKLDETVMHTNEAWAADIRRQRHIGDFTRCFF